MHHMAMEGGGFKKESTTFNWNVCVVGEGGVQPSYCIGTDKMVVV